MASRTNTTKTLRIFIASPKDALKERDAADAIIKEVSKSGKLNCKLESVRWEMNIAPGFRREHIQTAIDREARVDECDIVVVILRQRIGTRLSPGAATGTMHEFNLAYKSWVARELPWIMVYFDTTPFYPTDDDKSEQYHAVQSFKFSLRDQENGVKRGYSEYHGLRDFKSKFGTHLPRVVKEVGEKFANRFSKQKYDALLATPSNYKSLSLSQTAGSIHSSFSPYHPQKPFRRARIATTTGYVPDLRRRLKGKPKDKKVRYRQKNHRIYILRDPIRPFEIQIGEFRAKRWGREPREVPFEGLPSLSELKKLYPLLIDPQHRWLRIVLAELISDPNALEYMEEGEGETEDEDAQIRKVIARNPSAPEWVKEQECLFCNRREFWDLREIDQTFSSETLLIANDFPFGPFFHYIAFPRDGVHAWDAVKEKDLFGMNWVVHQYLRSRYESHSKTIKGASGVRFGFNSSIRHLVLARRTRTSAGASIAHVHKQVWGMGMGSVNLADYLRDICLKCESDGKDYLGAYLKALEDARMVIWSDKNVALFVPFGQIALHELQIMIKRPTRTFLDLNRAEVMSLSRAEYIVAQLYGRMDINSFNEIMLSLPFADESSKTFRLIFTFITREVDLAVSELSLLYVVDKHPYETVVEIDQKWPSRKIEDLAAD